MGRYINSIFGGIIAFILLCFCGQDTAQQYRDQQKHKKQTQLVATKVEEEERLRKKTSFRPDGKKTNPFKNNSSDFKAGTPLLRRIIRPQQQHK